MIENSRVIDGHEGVVTTVAFFNDGLHLLSGGRDRSVRVWRIDNLSANTGLYRPEVSIGVLAFSAAGDHLWGTEDLWFPFVWCWDVSTGVFLGTMDCSEKMSSDIGDEQDTYRISCGPYLDIETRIVITHGEATVWFPASPSSTEWVQHPNEPVWAGANGNDLYLIKLEIE